MILLGGATLALDDLVRAARGAPISLAPDAVARIDAGAARFAALAASGRAIYGYTTGFGALEEARVAPADNAEHQRRLLRSHAAGVGAPMPDEVVRAMLVQRLHVLGRGASGVRRETAVALVALLERGITPVVPRGGSVGASDLAPLAHAALVLIGEGRARVDGEVVPGHEALARVGLAPIALAGRDAFALVNGLAQSVAYAALAVSEAEALVALADAACALGLAARGAPTDFLDPRLAAAKGHVGQDASAARLLALVAGAPARGTLLRTTLSTRYAPHVHGAAWAAVGDARAVTQTELDAVVDNPVLLGDDLTSNSGNTSGQELALAMDQLATALASVAVISERRIDALLDAHRSGLPAFLVHPRAHAGLDSGLMMAQVTAASLVAELRARAVPASLLSVPTGAGTEDHVSMSALAARHAAWVVETTRTVLAIELVCAAQATDLAGGPPPALAGLHGAVRACLPVMVEDRVIGDDVAALLAFLRGGGSGGGG